MQRTEFNQCLNKQIKFWNIQAGALIGMAVGGCLLLIINGMIWGLAGGVTGFIAGHNLGSQWHIGNVQRWLYWQLPFSSLLMAADSSLNLISVFCSDKYEHQLWIN